MTDVKSLSPGRQTLRRLVLNPSVLIGGTLVAMILALAILAPVLGTRDPNELSTSNRLKPPGYEGTMRVYTDEGRMKVPVWYPLGADTLGRDVYSRIVYGARISLVVGVSVAGISIALGVLFGLIAGYFRYLDGVIMRVMDGLMAIPAILLAIAVVSVFNAGVMSVIIAIVVPEVPRVVRLGR